LGAISVDKNVHYMTAAAARLDRPQPTCEPRGSQSYPLDFVLRKSVLGAIIKLRRARALVRGHRLRVLERAAVTEIGSDPGCAEGNNARSGLCFPSYETIAEAAHCARSTVAEALKALEDAGIMTWVQRVKRVRERCADLLGDNGWRWRVLRTSNAYAFTDPSPAADRPNSSKSEKPTGTPNQEFPLCNTEHGAGVRSLWNIAGSLQSRRGDRP
jgi:AraC-like DNA-binding protein